MGGESDMWEAVKRVNAIADKKFVKREYEVLNGKHFNEYFALKEVSEMYSSKNGGQVSGELISLDEVRRRVSDIPKVNVYDAYVGINGFLHDLANSRLSTEEIINAAKTFFGLETMISLNQMKRFGGITLTNKTYHYGIYSKR